MLISLGKGKSKLKPPHVLVDPARDGVRDLMSHVGKHVGQLECHWLESRSVCACVCACVYTDFKKLAASTEAEHMKEGRNSALSKSHQ